MHGKSLSKLALEQQKPVSFTSVIAMAKLYLDPSEKDLRWVLNVAVEGHQASWKKTGKGNNKDGSVIYGSSGFRFAGGKRFFHVTSIIRVGITFSSAIKTWQKKAWKHISVCALQGASLRFNYPADVKMWREKKKRKLKILSGIFCCFCAHQENSYKAREAAPSWFPLFLQVTRDSRWKRKTFRVLWGIAPSQH